MEVFDMALKSIHSHHSEVIYFLLFLVNEAFDMALSAIIIAAIVAMGILLRYLLATSFWKERGGLRPKLDRAHALSGTNFQEGARDPTLYQKVALHARTDPAEGLLCKRFELLFKGTWSRMFLKNKF